jgi:hypothetical protein
MMYEMCMMYGVCMCVHVCMHAHIMRTSWVIVVMYKQTLQTTVRRSSLSNYVIKCKEWHVSGVFWAPGVKELV